MNKNPIDINPNYLKLKREMKKKEELELLTRIKHKLMEEGFMVVSMNNVYTLNISSEDWHKIFKTDQFNEMKNGSTRN
jgi:hypothetical protein